MGITFRAHFDECMIYGERISRCVVVFVFVNDGVVVISWLYAAYGSIV